MLKGKIALITGANKGIGLAITKTFLENNATIIANYKSECKNLENLKNKFKEKLIILKADVSKMEEVKSLFSQAKTKVEKIDILVNNAGILRDNLLLMVKEEEWDSVIGTNLKGAFMCSQQAVKGMMRNGKGCIINISSIVGIRGNSGQCAYSASKAGLIGFTKSAAKELGEFNIRVNAIAPGVIDTEMISHLKPEKIESFKFQTPLKRIGSPEEIAKTALFLASDDSSFITGQVISVDGGLIL